MTYLLIPLMAYLSRLSGRTGFGPFPELAYGAVFGLACYSIYGNLLLSLVAFIVSWRAMELGHGTFYDMKGWRGIELGTPDKPRKQFLDYILLPLFRKPQTPLYSWAAMGLKGFLVGLPLGAFSLLYGPLFAGSYYVSRKYYPNKPELAEWLAGGCAGLVIALSLEIS